MGNCREAPKVKVTSILNKAFKVLSGVIIWSEKRHHFLQMIPYHAKMCFGQLIYLLRLRRVTFPCHFSYH